VSVGPGSVDPTTGQLTLTATDVSLGGAGGVSRTYESRNLAAGLEGPLGPQWAISLGGGEGLTALPNGSVVLAGSSGGRTTFTRNEKGEFESPKGDGNLKIEAKEQEKGKGITAYLLKSAAAGTTTEFKQPTGIGMTYTNQFGSEAAPAIQPVSDATDSSGAVWVTDNPNNRIVKYSSAGTLLAAYGSYGSGAGQFIAPWGIAVNQSNGLVYVTDQANNRIEELSATGAFIRAFGTYGSGNGQVKSEAGLTVDSSGNVWVVDYGNSRIEEFNAYGEFLQTFGSPGSGNGQFKEPLNVTMSGGNLYVTDFGNNRVQEFSTTGGYLGQFGSAGSGNGQFLSPYGIATDAATGNLYVADYGNARVQAFSPAGAFITKFGSSGSGPGQLGAPAGVAVGPSGGVYVSDYYNSRVEEWAHASWLPTIAEGPLSSGTTTYSYQTVEVEGKAITEPTEALAPAPSGVSCAPKLERGCRALTFNYAKETTAKGENQGEWGDYAGHLTRMYFHGWDPSTKAMTEPIVAQYEYDAKGRLRAAWDPRISPALKTTYGYDPEGHVTAVASAGQQPWLLHYGAIAADSSTGRLLSVARPPAATTLGNGGAPQNTAAPSLSSSTPVMGTALSVTNGSWSNSPLSYSYQWEDCNSSGAECVAILGAVNQSYTPIAGDGGYTLEARVTATNAGGSTVSSSPATNAVPGTAPSFSLAFGKKGAGNGELNGPTTTATDASGNVWVTDTTNNRIQEFSPAGAFMAAYGSYGSGNGQFSGPWGIAINKSTGNVYVSDQSNFRVEEFASTGTFIRSFGSNGSGNGQFSWTAGLAIDPSGNVWVDDYGNNRVQEFTESGQFLQKLGSEGTGNGQFKGPLNIAFSAGNLYVVDYGNNRVQAFSMSGGYLGQFGSTGSGNGQFLSPWGIATDPRTGDLYVADYGNGRVQQFNPAGGYVAAFGSAGTGNGQFSGPTGVATGASGEIYAEDNGNNRIEKWTPTSPTQEPIPPAPSAGTAAVSTLEYHVPVSGSGLPNLSPGEVAKWGQNEQNDPSEGMALFPPDKPMGWPAATYERATIRYLDARGRTVNLAAPSGGIATTEYNETNDVVRTLSADNRAAARKEGAKFLEVSKKLDTESTYNEEGTELLETLGPEHKVKLAAGGEVQARAHVVYHYDQGAPEGLHFGLVTETTDAAAYEGKEADPRTTKTSYSGSGSCQGHEVSGWTLRKPTSTITDPGGLTLTHTTVYDPCTGNVLETTSPAGNSTSPLAYSSKFGVYGAGKGQFASPKQIAADAKGNLWIADEANSRIDVVNESNEFVKMIGWGVIDGKAELETCTKEATTCKVGLAGSGNGQFKEPRGVALDGKGNMWVVDTGNNRLQELTESGTFQKAVGSSGAGKLQFNSPRGVTIDSHGALWIADDKNSRLEKLNEKGEFAEALGWGVTDGKAELEICTAEASKCQIGTTGSGSGEFNEPKAQTFDAQGNLWVADGANNRLQEFNEKGEYVRTMGSLGAGQGQLSSPKDLKFDAHGNLWVVDEGNYRVEQFNSKYEFQETAGWGVTDGKAELETCTKEAPNCKAGAKGAGTGEFSNPWGIVLDAHGGLIVSDESDHRIQRFTTSAAPAHSTQMAYYTKAANPSYPACGEHPEWVNLPCETLPAAQPEAGPSLPVSTVTYNVWDEAETTTEKFGTTSRIKTQTYDPAGRALTSETTSTIDTPLPKVTNEYNTQTGTLEKQSTTTEGKTKTITSIYNTLGQLTTYTDADGNTSTYEYEKEKDMRLAKLSDGKGSQTYSYDPATGAVKELVDSAAGVFTAGYDVEGKMTSQSYPNGMTASYSLNPLGQATSVEYVKMSHCSEKCTWLSDSVTPSIHGETLAQTSTLAKDSYTYDNTGRLTQTQEEPAGKGCTARLYLYDEEANRTRLTTRAPGTEGKCASEGGTSEAHSYDNANRITDSGVAYETFGNTTKVPAADAGGNELASTYYVDGQLSTQTQNGETVNYGYDPAGRTRETVSTGKTSANVISHYSGAGNALTWTSETGEKWTRNIPGIDGTLCATQSSAAQPVLQLRDLQGNIIATAAVSETETKLLSTYNSTEFGVPQPGTTPPKYAWLGATGLATELTSGTATKSGASYVPQVARSLQTEPVVPPGSFPNGTGSGSPYTATISAWSVALSEQQSAGVIAEYAAKQKAAAEQAEREQIQACEVDPYSCELVDPNSVHHYREFEASHIAWALRRGDLYANIAELVSLIGATASETVIGAIVGHFSSDRIKLWFNVFASFLEYCVSDLHASHHLHGGCRASIPVFEVGPVVTDWPNFYLLPEVSFCLGMSPDTKEVHWCTREYYNPSPGVGA
jgi:DNA-binding beta-propeller fold protein YncE